MNCSRIGMCLWPGVLLSLAAHSAPLGSDLSPSDPWVMGILGDSISAGTLADVPLPQQCHEATCIRDWAEPYVSEDGRLIYTNKSTYSWGSGRKIQSHFIKLKDYLLTDGDGAGLEVLNVSKPGATAGALPDQARALLSGLTQRRSRGLLYVALTIGANDACDGAAGGDPQSVELQLLKLETGVREMLAVLRSGAPGAHVLFVGPPHIPGLGEDWLQDATSLLGLSCQSVRNRILHFCDSLTDWRGQGLAGYRRASSIMQRFESTLRRVVESEAALPGLKIAYSGRLWSVTFHFSDLAADCFHPSALGQEKISQGAWLDQPWFR